MSIAQIIKKCRPALLRGYLTKVLHYGERVSIGRRFAADSLPDITVTDEARVVIGDGVTLRKGVEIRAHRNAEIRIENGAQIDRGVRILASNNARVVIGERSKVGLYSVLNGGDSIEIGRGCLISGFVYLQTSMHRHTHGIPIQSQGYDHAPVVIEDDAWLGAHVVVLPGCRIGRGAIAGSNAVVTRNVDAGSVVAGVPATVLKTRHES